MKVGLHRGERVGVQALEEMHPSLDRDLGLLRSLWHAATIADGQEAFGGRAKMCA
jgi:hypothetical protein